MDVGIENSSLAYTDGMKIIFAVLLSLMFVACNSPEAENLKKENADLKTQLETVTRERDALKIQMDSIKAVLENASGTMTTTPNSSSPDSSTTPTTPDSGATTGSDMGTPNTSSDSSATPSPDQSTPESSTPAPSTAGSSPPSSALPSTDNSGNATPANTITNYAQSVLDAAKKYNDETQQTPPTDCSSGYTAGTHAVPSSDAIASCRVDRVDKGFRITLKDANGAVTTLSDAVAKP